MPKKVLIIVGVATGAKAAARIARRDPEAEVTIIEKGNIISYGACGLPYFISDVVKDHRELMSTPIGVIRDENFFKNVKGVTVYTKTRAEEIDREKKLVKTKHTETGAIKEFPYDKLVLAVGGSPVVPSLEGINLNNIYQLKTIEDGIALKNYLQSRKTTKAVIVGAGLIGMEMAEALNLLGVEVTVIEMLDWILPTILDKDLGLIVGRYLQGKGITVRTSEKMLRLEGDSQGAVKKVVTEKNQIEADVVLLSIGVRPNVELAKKAGLAIGETGAISVNEFLQTTDPDIYAGGDCVENTHRLCGKKVYTPLGSTANKHGRIIADQITGGGPSFPGVLGTAICKVLDFNVAKTGLSEKEAVSQGIDIETILCPGQDRPHYYPGNATIIIKLVAEKKTHRLLGAQIVGPGDVAKRLDIVVTALSFGATIEGLSTLDLAYAPPFSSAMDAIITAAHVMENKLNGLAKSLSPLAVQEKIIHNDDFILLDVRSMPEYEAIRIRAPKVRLSPLGKLRGDYKNLPQDKEIITFCKVSQRGYEAQRILEAQGFKNVKFLDGGIVAWPFATIGKVW